MKRERKKRIQQDQRDYGRKKAQNISTIKPENENGVSILQTIPSDCLIYVFQFLSIQEIGRVSCVCKEVKNLTYSNP